LIIFALSLHDIFFSFDYLYFLIDFLDDFLFVSTLRFSMLI